MRIVFYAKPFFGYTGNQLTLWFIHLDKKAEFFHPTELDSPVHSTESQVLLKILLLETNSVFSNRFRILDCLTDDSVVKHPLTYPWAMCCQKTSRCLRGYSNAANRMVWWIGLCCEIACLVYARRGSSMSKKMTKHLLAWDPEKIHTAACETWNMKKVSLLKGKIMLLSSKMLSSDWVAKWNKVYFWIC